MEDWTVEVVDAETVPAVDELFGANATGKRGRAGTPGTTPREEAIRLDAARADLDVIKLMGRLTVVRWDEERSSVERFYCFRLKRAATSRHRARKVARLGLSDVDPFEYRCANGAGEGTLHVGSGGCRYHGGNNYGKHFNDVNSGSRAARTRYDVATALLGLDETGMAQGMLEQMDILDELVLQRQMLNEYLSSECFDEDGRLLAVIDPHVIEQAMKWTDSVTKTVERAKRIENESALTRAHVLYLIDALTTLGKRYVPEDRLKEYGRDLLYSFGLETPDEAALQEPRAEDIGKLVAEV